LPPGPNFALIEFLPFLIPLIIAELAAVGFALRHILTHPSYKIGSRALWIAVTVVLMNTFIGPILYFVFGREDA
jgi:hypothetical protein